MDFAHTRLSLRRSPLSYAKVQTLISALIRNRLVNRSRLRKPYLDVGCGPNMNAHFINLDYGWRPGVDLCWDVAKRLPLPDASLRGVFSEHCLEHVSLDTMAFALREFHRVLESGGVVRIVVPDAGMYLSRYVSGESLPYAEFDRFAGIYSPVMSVNRVFREYGHQFMYDFDMLRQMLEGAGFSDIRRESFRHGRNPELLIDTEGRAIESLYVEAAKITAHT